MNLACPSAMCQEWLTACPHPHPRDKTGHGKAAGSQSSLPGSLRARRSEEEPLWLGLWADGPAAWSCWPALDYFLGDVDTGTGVEPDVTGSRGLE